jgi:hypothetical protein
MTLRNFGIVLVSFVVLSSCSSVNPRTGEKEDGFPIHGNFCGPFIPNVTLNSVQTPEEQFESISPIDSLDAACKAHDLC